MKRDGALSYLLSDHLGSTALTLDSAGNRLATNTELRYFPYGLPRYTAGTTPTSFNFTGQRRDSGSGLLFYNARWYDPVVGRFLQADRLVPAPGDPQSLNRYSYANNSPLRYTDPSGHAWALPDWEGVTTPVGILDPNRVPPDDQRRILFAWFEANPSYSLATDPVLAGETRAQPLELSITNSLLAMEYGFWQLERGDRNGLDTVSTGLLGAVVVLGPGAGSGMPGQNQGPTTYRGGAYGKIQARGLEAHHMPADSTTGIPTKLGPAIQMDRFDHRDTSSWGPGTAADAFRTKIKTLVGEGRMRDAMAIEIWDIRRVAGSKYNAAIQEMLEYAKGAGFIGK